MPLKSQNTQLAKEQSPSSSPHPKSSLGRSLNLHELCDVLGIKRNTAYNRLRKGGKYFCPLFPRPVKEGRLSRWVESEVVAYLQKRMQDRA